MNILIHCILKWNLPTYIEDDPKRQALRYATEALGAYLSHKSNGKEFCPDLVLKYARKYAEVCRKKKLIRKYAGRSLKARRYYVVDVGIKRKFIEYGDGIL